ALVHPVVEEGPELGARQLRRRVRGGLEDLLEVELPGQLDVDPVERGQGARVCLQRRIEGDRVGGTAVDRGPAFQRHGTRRRAREGARLRTISRHYAERSGNTGPESPAAHERSAANIASECAALCGFCRRGPAGRYPAATPSYCPAISSASSR